MSVGTFLQGLAALLFERRQILLHEPITSANWHEIANSGRNVSMTLRHLVS